MQNMQEMKRATLETKDASYEGILIQEKEGFYVLKLESGYNIGIKKEHVTKITATPFEPKTAKTLAPSHDPSKPTVTIILTGGTIASRVNYQTGGVSAQFTAESIYELFPEIKEIANLDMKLVGNIMSENMRFENYNSIAKGIYEAMQTNTKGIIVAHGTDTLHYTSAALSFMFPKPPIPIILTASQRSSDRPSSDAALNLISSVRLICETDFAGVGVVMHESTDDTACVLLRGVACRKMHSTRRDAFKPINQYAWARIPLKEEIEFISDYPKGSDEKIEKPKMFDPELKIGILKTYPNMHSDVLKPYEKYDGLIIEGTGIGHVPIGDSKENEEFAKALGDIAKKIPVAMALQTIYGRVCMNMYTNSRKAMALGLIGNDTNMTPETAFIKLAWCISNYPDKVKEKYHENLAGEMSEYSTMKGYAE
jgi:glutamyl-tRNA(Gln) amidotransferase subunit D